MNRPICLIGSIDAAKDWISSNIDIDNYDSLILEESLSVDDIKTFRDFLNEISINKKIGIIYGFNKLNDAKQSILLKIFESLSKDVNVIIHSYFSVSFVINTRCDVKFLKNTIDVKEDISFLLNYFYELLNYGSVMQEQMQGIKVYLETLNLYNLKFLSNEDKDCILRDLKG